MLGTMSDPGSFALTEARALELKGIAGIIDAGLVDWRSSRS